MIIKSDCVSLEISLSILWRCVIKPVLNALAFSIPGGLSRIFWCPTGSFSYLPIHAAGFYDEEYSEPGHKVYDYVVSSYVPSLTSLAPTHVPVSAPHDNLRVLLVPQPPSDGKPPLPGVAAELECIKNAIANPTCISLVKSVVGTVEEVLTLMTEADWVHFACHGIQDGVDSGFYLANGRRLRVRDMMAMSRPFGGLAFLSACQTAGVGERLPDEAIHIAAAMLYAGFGGVIGTTGDISDRVAPTVARDVYGYLFRDGSKRPDYREAAQALHDAIGRLRASGASFDEWVSFIHMGL